jgi:hypothetical protein
MNIECLEIQIICILMGKKKETLTRIYIQEIRKDIVHREYACMYSLRLNGTCFFLSKHKYISSLVYNKINVSKTTNNFKRFISGEYIVIEKKR